MTNKDALLIDPRDNVAVALRNIEPGAVISTSAGKVQTATGIPQKHKVTLTSISAGQPIIMYGVIVGRATTDISAGALINTKNIRHDTEPIVARKAVKTWNAPDASSFEEKTFMGYRREDGRTGTMNYWIVVPLVFCENRNIEVIREAMLEKLGYPSNRNFGYDVTPLVDGYRNGMSIHDLEHIDLSSIQLKSRDSRIFPNVDGVRFLTHEGGCGGTREDSETLCRLIATYIAHPNVAGATILGLGCQNAQYEIVRSYLEEISPSFSKPLFYLNQQDSTSERQFISEAIKKTFIGLVQANKTRRTPSPLHHLTLGLECGGSDGFSGITANPALGHASDLLVALGGSAILAEFPELHGVEQELINRCVSDEEAHRFESLMRSYHARAKSVGSGFEANPSPGNIRDGLITDAIKSAGAAKKGGTSPITHVLDYTEIVHNPGLHLLCTPGGDVESTTGLASAGANLIVFTTGLGTPTGNAITPVIKMSTNTSLYDRMNDIIDIDAGTIIDGSDSIESKGRKLLQLIIDTASGNYMPHAVRLGQDDFIPWKRGVSL